MYYVNTYIFLTYHTLAKQIYTDGHLTEQLMISRVHIWSPGHQLDLLGCVAVELEVQLLRYVVTGAEGVRGNG